MQELLHHALATPQTFGLLAGNGNMIEIIYPLTSNMLEIAGSDYKKIELEQAELDTGLIKLMGVYLATDQDGKINAGQKHQLSSYFKKHSGKTACCHLLLELGTEGRLDALMFADAEHNTPIPLDMQED